MPYVGFEPTITASERAKTVHALDRSATLTDHEEMRRSTNWEVLGADHNSIVCLRPKYLQAEIKKRKYYFLLFCIGARGSVVGWGTMLQTGRSPDFFNPSNRTMALGSTQPVTEMSTRNLPGGKKRPARRADNLTAICEPIV
jgi:hypothetical protein